MSGPLVVIFHQPPRDGDPPLVRLVAEARDKLAAHHRRSLARAGAGRLLVVPGRDRGHETGSFGKSLADVVRAERPANGLVVLGSGAVPLLRRHEAARLIDAAQHPGRRALTNNRFSSDVCAISDAMTLRGLPPLPSDNALPRWLEERAGYRVQELGHRSRLALDLDTPLDLALLRLHPRTPHRMIRLAAIAGVRVPCLDPLRQIAADPRAELVVAGRTGSRTLRWLERNVRCRVRFLAEERGLRASSPLATGDGDPPPGRPPRSILGRLLHDRGPDQLGAILSGLGDGAIVDSRVLLADRSGADESAWPAAEDRFASDLLRADDVRDPWLSALTRAAAEAPIPVQLGAHTLVGPGIRVLLRPHHPAASKQGRCRSALVGPG